MNKPTLCKILGVEPSQEFMIAGLKNTKWEDVYHVDLHGDFTKARNHEFGSAYALCYAIRHPDEIIDAETGEFVWTGENDPINHPSHYCSGDYECIDIMLATQGKDDVQGYCVCNAIKYLWRHKGKGGLEDVKKARWYLDEYIRLDEEENPEEEKENES